MKIAFAQGSQMNIKMTPVEMTFEEFSKGCSLCRKGGKHERYFIRGGDMIESLGYVSSGGKNWGDGFFRNDASLSKAAVVVLDGDSSLYDPNCAPDPAEVHDYLVKAGINHFIYTTHSNRKDRNKWRCVIECDMESKEMLAPTVKRIVKELNDDHIHLRDVKENSVWSQPWFLPTRDDPADGLFKHMEYLKGKAYHVGEVKELVTSAAPAPAGNLTGESKTIKQMESEIEQGIELHPNLLALTWGLIKDGSPELFAVQHTRGLMDRCSDEVKATPRWQERYQDVPRIVSAAGKRLVNESGDNVVQMPLPERDSGDNERSGAAEIDWPPGQMGELARACYDFSPHPYRLVSVVAALGLTAGITGRKFNISGTGLNIYMTLLMPTGSGKNVVKDFIKRVLMESDRFDQGIRFIGPKRFTSPKGIIDCMNENRCMVSIQTEAGMLFKSAAGDQAGILRTFLDLYGCSGQFQFSDPEAYSSKDNSLPALRSPALTLINEATPVTFESELGKRDSIESGELARMSLFKYVVKKPDYNPEQGKLQMSKELKETINGLMEVCLQVQRGDDLKGKIVDMDYSLSRFMEFSRECVAEENRLMTEDNLRKAMFSRAPLKCLKIAALCAVMDNSTKVSVEHWEWARQLFEYELTSLGMLGRAASGSDPLDFGMNIMFRNIYLVLTGAYKDPKKRMPESAQKAYVFSYYALTQTVRAQKDIQELGTPHKAGLLRILEHAEQMGLIRGLEPADLALYMRVTSKTKGYKLTNAGVLHMKQSKRD